MQSEKVLVDVILDAVFPAQIETAVGLVQTGRVMLRNLVRKLRYNGLH